MTPTQDPGRATRWLYSIPYHRALTVEEQSLLRDILERVDPGRLGELDALQVIGRCGCGTCPTVIFGATRDQPISTNPASEIAQYTGVNAQGVEVGLSLIVRDGALSELETWGLDGAVTSLPSLRSMVPRICNDPAQE